MMSKISSFVNNHRAIIAPILILILIVTILLLTFTGSKNEITADDVNKIDTGTSYEEVVSILGKGEEMDQPGLNKKEMTMYEWNNSDGSGVSMIIKDGVVFTKAGYGLE